MSFDKLPDNVLILLIQDNLPQIEGKARDVEGTWKPAPPRGTKARRLNAQVSFSMVNKRVRLLASPSLFDVISFKSQSTLDHDVADLEFVIKSSSMMLQCVKSVPLDRALGTQTNTATEPSSSSQASTMTFRALTSMLPWLGFFAE